MSRLRRGVAFAALAALTAIAAPGASPAGNEKRALEVGLVTTVGALNDRSAGESVYRGIVRAVEELGVRGRVLTPGPSEGLAPSLEYLGRQRYDVVVVGFYADAGVVATVTAVARRFPATTFVLPDVSVVGLPDDVRNVRGLVFRSEEAGFLAGYLAGLIEKQRPGRDVVGAVGGAPLPGVDLFIAGFQAGARKASPGIQVLVGYADDFVDTRRCRTIARRQIGRGAGVVFQVAARCGFGALRVARALGAWGIGVDADQSYLGRHILTSAVKREDVAIVETIRRIRDGTISGRGDTTFGVANGGVGLGRVAAGVPPRLAAAVERVRRQVAAGTIRGIPTALS